jgi:hypothetical protein
MKSLKMSEIDRLFNEWTQKYDFIWISVKIQNI